MTVLITPSDRPESTVTLPVRSVCVNDPVDWRSVDDESCMTYQVYGYCTEDGKEGDSWNSIWGDVFTLQGSQSTTAMEACCECGGGKQVALLDKRDDGCTDWEWKSVEQQNCAEWTAYEFCESTGEPGPGWDEVWGRPVDFHWKHAVRVVVVEKEAT